MRDLESEYRVIEMLHAIKIFINVANRLIPKDIESLKQVADFMNKKKETCPKEMTVLEIEKVLGHPVKIIRERVDEKM